MKTFMGPMIRPPVVEVVLQLLYRAKKTLVALYLQERLTFILGVGHDFIFIANNRDSPCIKV
jgi:hypothetical protein